MMRPKTEKTYAIVSGKTSVPGIIFLTCAKSAIFLFLNKKRDIVIVVVQDIGAAIELS